MRRIIYNSILISLALTLSLVEKWFPLNLLVPLPGIKLGLANVVTLFALFYLGFQSALMITVLRCVLGSIFYGGIIALSLSLSGAILALLVMALLKRGYGRWFSVIGISIGGAAAHNIGQVAMASAIMGSSSVFAYLIVLLLVAVITGVLTGTVASALFEKLEKTGTLREKIA